MIRTVGLIELKERHTADYIAELIHSCLLSYQVEISQIVSLTTDNAANMGATVKRLNEFFEQSEDEEESCETEERIPDHSNVIHISEESYEEELHEVLHESDVADKELLNDLIDDSDEYSDLLNQLVSDFQRKYTTSLIYVNGVSRTEDVCRAHSTTGREGSNRFIKCWWQTFFEIVSHYWEVYSFAKYEIHYRS